MSATGLPRPRMRQSAVIPKFAKMAAGGERITIQGDGQQWRQFLHVWDAADAFVPAVSGLGGGRVHNVTGDERSSVRQTAETAGGQTGLVSGRAGDAEPLWIGKADTRHDPGWARSRLAELKRRVGSPCWSGSGR